MLNVEILRVHPGLSAGMYPGSWSWCHPDMWKQRAFWHSLTMQWLISQCDGSCKDYKTMQNKRGIHKLHRKTGRQICTANNLEKVVFPAGRPRQNLMVPLTLLAKRHPISRTGNFCASSPCSSPQPSRPKLAKSAEEADVYTDLCFQEYRGVAADTQDHEPGTWEAPMGRALTLVRIRVGVKLERRWHRKCSLTSQTFSHFQKFNGLPSFQGRNQKADATTRRPSLLKLPASCWAAGGPSPHSPHRGTPPASCGLGQPLPDSPASNEFKNKWHSLVAGSNRWQQGGFTHELYWTIWYAVKCVCSTARGTKWRSVGKFHQYLFVIYN